MTTESASTSESTSGAVTPRGSAGAANTSSGVTLRAADDLGPLPDGWEQRIHADGRDFYINHGNIIYLMSLKSPNTLCNCVIYKKFVLRI